jgi:hypothetical protein
MKFGQVILSEAAHCAAQPKDLFDTLDWQKRSLHFASLRSAPVGMTEGARLDLA